MFIYVFSIKFYPFFCIVHNFGLVSGSQDSYLLLDCGEGSWGQLVRLMGEEGAMGVCRGLKVRGGGKS